MESRLEQIILQAADELRAADGADVDGSGAARVGGKRLAALIRAANRGIARNEVPCQI